MKTHPDIAPELAAALRKVRDLFRRRPRSYDGSLGQVFLTNPYVRKNCGCIVAHVAKKTDPASGFASLQAVMARFPLSRLGLIDMFGEAMVHSNSAIWARKRITRFLATNT